MKEIAKPSHLVYAFPIKMRKNKPRKPDPQSRLIRNPVHSTSQGIEPQLLHKNERDCTLSRFKMRKNKPDFDSCRFVNGLRFSNIKMRKQTLSDRAFKSHPLNEPRNWTPARPQKTERDCKPNHLVYVFPDQTPLLFIPSLYKPRNWTPARPRKMKRDCKPVSTWFAISRKMRKKQTKIITLQSHSLNKPRIQTQARHHKNWKRLQNRLYLVYAFPIKWEKTNQEPVLKSHPTQQARELNPSLSIKNEIASPTTWFAFSRSKWEKINQTLTSQQWITFSRSKWEKTNQSSARHYHILSTLPRNWT